MVSLEPSKSDAAALDNLTNDWNSAMGMLMENALDSIAEGQSARAALEVKEPEFKKGKLGEDESRKISAPISSFRPFRVLYQGPLFADTPTCPNSSASWAPGLGCILGTLRGVKGEGGRGLCFLKWGPYYGH